MAVDEVCRPGPDEWPGLIPPPANVFCSLSRFGRSAVEEDCKEQRSLTRPPANRIESQHRIDYVSQGGSSERFMVHNQVFFTP